MTRLYTDLARVYHEMYQTLFDYKAEFKRYHTLLQTVSSCRSVLEVGCGSGNLAPFFHDAGYTYCGLDLNREMLAIAREYHPQADFMQADMREFRVAESYDAVIVSGRSFGYLITNQDVLQALACFRNALTSGGILILDSFDAETVIQNEYPPSTQEVECDGRKVTRINRRSPNLETGFTWNWEAEYHIVDDKGNTSTVQDQTVLRAFTESELKLFLKISGFTVIEVDKENQMLLTCQRQN